MHFWKKGKEQADGATPLNAHGTILVVDDEPVMRAITGAVLNALGWNVLNAGSGEEAVRMTRFVQERGSRLAAMWSLFCEVQRTAGLPVDDQRAVVSPLSAMGHALRVYR